jgi:uracil-DNA glycosylase
LVILFIAFFNCKFSQFLRPYGFAGAVDYLYLEKNKMTVRLEESWKKALEAEFNKPYFEELMGFVASEYNSEESKICYPPGNQIFAAFDECPFDKIKVVIIGQDPYHGAGQANGLAFSVNDNIPFPPSLRNIFEEIRTDLGQPIPPTGNLSRWAKQGVLLLNASLTVRAGEAASHSDKGWEKFTDAVIRTISDQKENVVFLLWGGYAQKKGDIVNRSKHLVLESGHPSPLSANRGHWFGNGHFSKTNEFLHSKDKKEISW